MKQCAEDMELKLQGNKQSVVYSGIKNIVKTTSGKKLTHWLYDCLKILYDKMFFFCEEGSDLG